MSQQAGAPQPYPAEPPPPAASRKPGRRILVSVLSVIAIALIAFVVRFGLQELLSDEDRTAEAQAGDCISDIQAPKEGETTDAAGASVVDCASADARFTVVGRIDDRTKAEATDTVCQTYADAEYFIWAGEEGKKGYVLCLMTKR